MGLFLVVAWVLAGEGESEPQRPQSRAMLMYDFRDMLDRGEYDAVAWAGAPGVEGGVFSEEGRQGVREALVPLGLPLAATALVDDDESVALPVEVTQAWGACRFRRGDRFHAALAVAHIAEASVIQAKEDSRWHERASAVLIASLTRRLGQLDALATAARASAFGNCPGR